jgi:hypothetical protein
LKTKEIKATETQKQLKKQTKEIEDALFNIQNMLK